MIYIERAAFWLAVLTEVGTVIFIAIKIMG